METTKAPNVDRCIAAFTKPTQRLLRQRRAAVQKAAESISYGMPAYKHFAPLVYFGELKAHVSLFAAGSG